MDLPRKRKDKPGCRWVACLFYFHRGSVPGAEFKSQRVYYHPNVRDSPGEEMRKFFIWLGIQLNCGKRTSSDKKFKTFVADSRAGGDQKKSLEIAQKIWAEKLQEFLDKGMILNKCAPQKSSIIVGFEVSSLYLFERNRAQEGQIRYAWGVMYKDIASLRNWGEKLLCPQGW